ncbi:hypothetical protein [Belliella pelovolcani]|uniref:Uncharacterized protein n=1 Tax=Belliella pelovolcani TaxID=529505 RepID=A0A1N7PK75_9BACT|nr:hypothetical protein [Belliella pelovolcani]SIT10992.1 hypothetical protein SAMN05421761_11718 [Belliella pelovolcani]
MIQKLRNRFKKPLQCLAVMMAFFFSVLAVGDGFEQVEEPVYVGEFVDEADFDYVDFPTSLLRNQSVNKLSKVQRLEIVKIFDVLVNNLTLNTEFVKISFLGFSGEIPYFQFVLEKVIASNAP